MLLFSVHPEPEGRKVNKMLTLKKVKEMVKAPVHTKRVPSPKVLLEDGRILLRKEFEHDSHLTLYHSGYVWFSAGKRNTVFHIHDCRGDYAYDAAAGKGEVIKEDYFENCEWHIRALFEGERRVEESQLKCEGVGQTKVCVSYHAVAEDWGEMTDSEINVLDSLELFGKDNHAKRLLTYAASFGNTTLEKLKKYKKADEVGALLKKFDAISVRDANSGTIVTQLTGKEPVYNLDPVLTYDYMNCCDKIPQVQTNEKYLILYAYAGRISNDEADWIAAYAKKKNLKVYAIGDIQKCADRFVDCSPFEVLAYFRNAEEVITDTFHGSIFSVITHRPFTTLIRKSVGNSYGNEEKLSDLLKRLGLANRMTTKIEDTENINEKAIDYAKVDEQLKAHREVAKEYLRKNLEE